MRTYMSVECKKADKFTLGIDLGNKNWLRIASSNGNSTVIFFSSEQKEVLAKLFSKEK